ncbi:putative MFS aflatoxin efflux pump [Xylariaceae sp. FL0594]|nr:putative MFS aflatoxin efflux pump [Xylariaceae sp. FL0594]
MLSRLRRKREREAVPVAPAATDIAANATAAGAPGNMDDSGYASGKQELAASPTNTSTKNQEYPTGVRLWLILSSIFISVFLISLDRLIVTTAIPAITDEFHSLPDVGWYGSAYLLTSCAFQLLFGKLYSFYPIRAVFATSVVLFEVGSALCGAAPNSIAFIFGRAIQGIGSAGIFSGAIVVIVYAVPLHNRPKYQGLFGAVFGISSILGPLVGGAFTSRVTWRWCFYINLPFGGVALLIIILLLRVQDQEDRNLSSRAKLSQLDAYGTAALFPAVVSLLLALQWGGSLYPWNNGRIIALLTLGIFLGIVFILVQAFLPKTATIPPRIFKQRSIVAGFWTTICLGSQMMIFVYFLPIWFQAIEGVSAVDSGIRLLPLTLSIVVASILNGIFVSRIGYYTPTLILGTAFATIGAGLLTTLQINSSKGAWIGYQIIYGLGQGLCFQAPNLAAQTVLPKKDVGIGASLMFFSQILGGAIFISVGQNVLNNQLIQRLAKLPGFTPKLIQTGGATQLINSFPQQYRHAAQVGYNESLRVVFQVGLALAALSVLGALGMEFRSVKEGQKQADATKDVEKAESGVEAKTGATAEADADPTLVTKSDSGADQQQASEHGAVHPPDKK